MATYAGCFVRTNATGTSNSDKGDHFIQVPLYYFACQILPYDVLQYAYKFMHIYRHDTFCGMYLVQVLHLQLAESWIVKHLVSHDRQVASFPGRDREPGDEARSTE